MAIFKYSGSPNNLNPPPNKLKYVHFTGVSQIGAIDEQGKTYILWWQPYGKVISLHDLRLNETKELSINYLIKNENVAKSCKYSVEYASYIKAALEQLANDKIL